MDTIERCEVFLRYIIMAFMSLTGYNNSRTFYNHLRKIDFLLSSDDYSDSESVQSDGSATCDVAEESMSDSEDSRTESVISTGTRESMVGPETPRAIEQESYEGQSDVIAVE